MEFRMQNAECRMQNTEYRIQNTEYREYGIRNTEYGITECRRQKVQDGIRDAEQNTDWWDDSGIQKDGIRAGREIGFG
jgi:hypothetical protein